MTTNTVLCVERIISKFPDINEGVFCVGYNHYWTKTVEFCRIKWDKKYTTITMAGQCGTLLEDSLSSLDGCFERAMALRDRLIIENGFGERRDKWRVLHSSQYGFSVGLSLG